MDAGSELIRQLLAALFVLGLLAALVWTLRGRNAGTGSNRNRVSGVVRNWLKATPQAGTIEVVERKALTPQHTLHRLRMSGREFLLATHPQGCQLIAELDAKDSSAGVSENGTASAFPAGSGV